MKKNSSVAVDIQRDNTTADLLANAGLDYARDHS